MANVPERTSGPLTALLALGWNQQIRIKKAQLPFPPFAGLGVRIDVYDILRVDSVVVGDLGYDVTCICTFESAQDADYNEARVRPLGFDEGSYP